MPATYSHTVFQTLVDQLAQDLGDSSKVFFLDAELQRNLLEAMRVWNLLTGYHRTSASFTTTAGTAFYNIDSQFSTLIGNTETDFDIIGDMQYRLMEPYDPADGTNMSEMFAHSEFVRALQQRRDKFLADTDGDITDYADIIVSAGTGIVELNDDVISIKRAVWEDSEGRFYNLVAPTDEQSSTSMIPSWRQSAAVPRSYSIVVQPNLQLQLIPPPQSTGTLHLWTCETGPSLNPLAPITLGVHDDLAWGVGWGAVAEQLMKDGIGRDPQRAAFCERLYALAVDLAISMPTVLSISINNVQRPTTSINMLDRMRAGWQGRDRGQPTTPALMGNWLALYPVPDDVYSVTVHMVRRTPEVGVAEQLQYGREQLSALLGWAKQLSLFKCQGDQLAQGVAAARQLVNQARVYNEERINRSTYLSEIYGQTPDRQWVPVREIDPRPPSESDDDSASSTGRERGNRSRRSGVERRTKKRLGGR